MSARSQWQSVPPDEAVRHPEYGLGGFLIFVAGGLALATVRISYTTIRDFIDIVMIAKPEAYAIYLGTLSAICAAFAVWALVALVLLLRRSPSFPRVFAMLVISGFVASFLEAISYYYIVHWLGGTISWLQVFDAETVIWLLRSATIAAIGAPYVILSRRVNVTFLNRVRDEDLTYLTPFPTPVVRYAASEREAIAPAWIGQLG